MYQGSSIVDYLKSTGQPTDFASRTQLATSKGITGYSGTAEQNTQLLNLLRGTAQATTASQPQVTQSQPTVSSPVSTPQANSSGMTPEGIPLNQLPSDLLYNGQLDISNPIKQTKYNEIVQQYKQNSSGQSTNLSSMFNTPSIDLMGIYDNLFKSSGITDIENDLSTKSKAYNETVAGIKDNPYLSEATMSGRLKKLEDKFNADTQTLRDDIAMKKADIEMRLNLQLKQFDINSQQAQQALTQFQTLLSSGALDSATGEDIANITRSTGISSTMIQSAINASKAKNVQTSIIQYDDGTNQGFAVVNSNTGEIISKQSIASSKPKSASASDTKEAEAQQTQENAIGDIQRGVTLRDLINHYAVAGGLSVEDLYRLYNSYSPYGQAKEDLEDVKTGKYVS